MSTPALVTTTLQNIVRLELAVKASIHDINTSDGPLDSLQRINADARKNVQEIKKALDDLETFAKGAIGLSLVFRIFYGCFVLIVGSLRFSPNGIFAVFKVIFVVFLSERDREDEKREILREVESQRRQLEVLIARIEDRNLMLSLSYSHGLVIPSCPCHTLMSLSYPHGLIIPFCIKIITEITEVPELQDVEQPNR